MDKETITLDQGYIKLYKNETQKAVKYNWEIKVYDNKVDDELIKEIKRLDEQMKQNFETEEITND